MLRRIAVTLCLLLVPLLAYAQQSIGIFTFPVSGQGPWDPDSIKQGIAGSEEAVIYVGQELANLGYRVVVYGNPPAGSRYSEPNSNPRYIHVAQDDKASFDIALSWRQPTNAAQLKTRARTVYLWPHDTYHWPLRPEQINGFDDVLWLTQWQRQQWISANPGFAQFTKIFGNGIQPGQFNPVAARSNPYSCVYGSNYARGLEVLLDIWPAVKARYPLATLDIYYGWQHWGRLSPEKEAKMRAQIAVLPDVRDHGRVGHEELNRAFETASLWTYPCIAPETFCITGLRAQMAGAVPVIIEGSALSDTVQHGYKCTNPQDYLKTLLQAMEQAEKISLEDRQKMGQFVLDQYTWKAIASRWKELFDSKLAAKNAVLLPTEAN
jgi:glycosyltransferase involved in cell wall biosynthesis